MRALKPKITRRAFVAGAAAGLAVANTARGAPAAQTLLLQTIPGQPAGPDFTLPALEGGDVRFADFRGRVVLVNFWATWCPPCRDEIPSMVRAWNTLKEQNVALLAIHVGGDADKIWEFLAQFDVTFPVLIDRTSAVSKAWATVGLPTTYVADGSGRKALRAIGGREWDHPDLLARILALKS